MDMATNRNKSDSELAWEYIRAEMERQFYEPLAILRRLGLMGEVQKKSGGISISKPRRRKQR